jgi:chlorobactene glucosyltransferase
MMLALTLFAVVTLLEGFVWLKRFWPARRALSIVTVLGLTVVNCLLLASHWHFWVLLITFASLYRIISLLRIVQNRTDAVYLRAVGSRSYLVLVLFQVVMLLLALGNYIAQLPTWAWLYAAAVPQFSLAVVILLSTNRNLRTTKPEPVSAAIADRDFPTLTVGIPARNETEDLESCVQSLIASDYPKLEIIVLDDCSQNKRTPEIMRQFAQDGVRFIAGKVPPEEWLAKNYAYYQLSKEANGELLLFCGVDTRFEASSLRLMVELLRERKKSMLSVIPANKLPAHWSLVSLMVQPGRYAWELFLPRRWLNRPPVLSTCWLIASKTLKEAGGLPAVRRKNSVESYFARYAATHDDGYSFIQSTSQIGLRSEKNFIDQRDTAIRTRYPQLHRRPELAGLLSLTELYVVSGPLILSLIGFVEHWWGLVFLSLSTVLLLNIAFTRIVSLTYRKFLFRGCWLVPFAILYDVGLLNYSMWQYEFGEIIWKGRNVCLPVMRAIPGLPKLQ